MIPAYTLMDAPACHIVGAGLAGLSAAQHLVANGYRVYVYEAAANPGGRCRSLPDKRLGAIIDNGSHLLFSSNRATRDFMKAVNAPDDGLRKLDGLPFYDLKSNTRWALSPKGKSAWWALSGGLRDLGISRAQLILDVARLAFAGDKKTVGHCIPDSTTAWQRLWIPFLEAVFNTEPSSVSAKHAYAILKTIIEKGAESGTPMQAIQPWSEILANPAVAHLRYHGTVFNYNMPLLSLDRGEGIVRRMLFKKGTIDTSNDAIILATPNAVSNRLCPDIAPAIDSAPIINVHFDVIEELGHGLCGMVGGISDWVFWRGKTVSITIGNARKYMSLSGDELAQNVWREAKAVLPSTMPQATPPHRRIVEKRATIAATPKAFDMRPTTNTIHPNLFLAGDWINTGLPSTIEGAILSGQMAAKAVIDKGRA